MNFLINFVKQKELLTIVECKKIFETRWGLKMG